MLDGCSGAGGGTGAGGAAGAGGAVAGSGGPDQALGHIVNTCIYIKIDTAAQMKRPRMELRVSAITHKDSYRVLYADILYVCLISKLIVSFKMRHQLPGSSFDYFSMRELLRVPWFIW